MREQTFKTKAFSTFSVGVNYLNRPKKCNGPSHEHASWLLIVKDKKGFLTIQRPRASQRSLVSPIVFCFFHFHISKPILAPNVVLRETSLCLRITRPIVYKKAPIWLYLEICRLDPLKSKKPNKISILPKFSIPESRQRPPSRYWPSVYQKGGVDKVFPFEIIEHVVRAKPSYRVVSACVWPPFPPEAE